MQIKIPYNAGELRKVSATQSVYIAGHIWWPVEEKNAYYCVILDKNNNLTDNIEYIWDYSNGEWPLIEAA